MLWVWEKVRTKRKQPRKKETKKGPKCIRRTRTNDNAHLRASVRLDAALSNLRHSLPLVACPICDACSRPHPPHSRPTRDARLHRARPPRTPHPLCRGLSPAQGCHAAGSAPCPPWPFSSAGVSHRRHRTPSVSAFLQHRDRALEATLCLCPPNEETCALDCLVSYILT
jgi:hypothetical protein